MSHPDLVTDPAELRCSDDGGADDPFTALHYHFGMLLGVDDFETEQAYHRGHHRLHQAWLHGPGVVWGLGVELSVDRGEVMVSPGLAVDGAGRDLHLDSPACLDPGAWYERHEDEVEPAAEVPAGADVAFDAHVEARFASCLTRPVPALAEPCEDAGTETAYSREWETIDLRLVPGAAAEPAPRYRRVRILLGLLEAGPESADQDAAQARADVLAGPASGRPAAALAAFRAMANLDARDLAPPPSEDGPRVLTPIGPPAPVVLANLRGVALRRAADGDGWELTGGRVDLVPRRSHVATETVQELVVAALAGGTGGGAAGGTGPSVTGVARSANVVTLTLSERLDDRSVQPEAFAAGSLTAGGWQPVGVTGVAQDATEPRIAVELAAEPAVPWQLIARGTGTNPLVDAELRPLDGGHDFVHIERS